tara:strand:+ start:168229 stop:169701 length:1473 start_codon:yes stop_codon:yes gene_type:complete
MDNVIVIGSGVAGIAVSIRLAKLGFKVKVFEANSFPGGKLSNFKLGKYRFDYGPSLFTMPELVKDLFSICDEDISKFFQYKRKEVSCNYFWEDGVTIKSFFDKKKFTNEISSNLNVDEKTILKYMNKSKIKYDLTESIFLKKSLHDYRNLFNKQTFKAILNIKKLDLNKTLHQVNQYQLKEKHLVQMFDRYATYNGSNPYKTSGIMSLIQHLENNIGTFIPKKGMVEITNSLFKLAKRQGVEFLFNSRINKIVTKDNKVQGVNSNGKFYESNILVSNSDVYYTYKKLLGDKKLASKLSKIERSSSAVIFYWGISSKFKMLDLHNILFSNDYKKEFENIFGKKSVSEDPTVYINITSKDVKSDAPKNSENWFVMVNVPSDSGQDWEKIVKKLRNNIIYKINKILKCEIRDYIEEEKVVTPKIIDKQTESFMGALYGNSSNDLKSSFVRHPNFSKTYDNLFFCGGTVHPGGGIPLCLNSAKIVSDLVSKNLT